MNDELLHQRLQNVNDEKEEISVSHSTVGGNNNPLQNKEAAIALRLTISFVEVYYFY